VGRPSIAQDLIDTISASGGSKTDDGKMPSAIVLRREIWPARRRAPIGVSGFLHSSTPESKSRREWPAG
jgi:hypothetical protein